MSRSSQPEDHVNDEAALRRAGFDRRERALLDAWDRSNTPAECVEPEAPDDLADALDSRLLTAYENARHTSLRDLEDRDRATCLQIAADCEAEARAELADRAQGPGADIGLFHEIARQHRGHLHRIAVRLTGNRDAAQDLVQETLVRALRYFDQFTQGTNARGWLVTILTRLHIDALKHAGVVSRAEGDLKTLALVESESEIPGIPDAQLWAAVDSLEPDLRTVVERCYIQQLSYKEVADELAVPIGTVGTRLRRARERLRVVLSTLV